MLRYLPLLIFLLSMVSSCGTLTVEKRHFRKGYHVSWNKKVQNSSIQEREVVHLKTSNETLSDNIQGVEQSSSNLGLDKLIEQDDELNDDNSFQQSNSDYRPFQKEDKIRSNVFEEKKLTTIQKEDIEIEAEVKQKKRGWGLVWIIIGSVVSVTAIWGSFPGFIVRILIGALLVYIGILLRRLPPKKKGEKSNATVIGVFLIGLGVLLSLILIGAGVFISGWGFSWLSALFILALIGSFAMIYSGIQKAISREVDPNEPRYRTTRKKENVWAWLALVLLVFGLFTIYFFSQPVMIVYLIVPIALIILAVRQYKKNPDSYSPRWKPFFIFTLIYLLVIDLVLALFRNFFS